MQILSANLATGPRSGHSSLEEKRTRIAGSNRQSESLNTMTEAVFLSRPIRIMVVDNDSAFLAIVSGRLKQIEKDCEIATFASPSDALNQLDSINPDLALIDIVMPEMDGFACAKAIREKLDRTTVLLVTGMPDVLSAYSAFRCGAYGVLRKPFTGEELRSAIHSAMTGLFACSRDALLLAKEHALPVEWHKCLSRRQREVAVCLIRGLTDKEIAAQLRLSPATVHTHVHQIYSRIGVSSREELIRRASPIE
jgi:DNA-binding NarL/FixJ family response regulator